ncbi:DUF433 domain-containing protein [Paracoccus subflavus]|uniref:DUF433 domain-containing protein n=1 Tax=Paracoccus subflavus TaxID=2528244 RepID=UPI0013EF06AF|nr:DUF433 domain-containing protein [Paracoccus subflavus]
MDDDSVIGAFGEEDAARLTGLSVGQLRSWDRSGFLHPSYAAENRRLPFSRIYSFRDIVSLRVLGELRNKHMVSMQHLKKVSHKLSGFGDSKWTATTLYVLGKRVVFIDPRTNERKEIVSGQRVLDIPLRIAISDARSAIRSLNEREQGEKGKIVHARFVLQNEPVFAGTRVPVAAVKRYLDAGFSAAEIIKEFPVLTLDDIEAAKAWSDKAAA